MMITVGDYCSVTPGVLQTPCEEEAEETDERKMDAEARQRTGAIYSATQGQTRKTRRSSGGAIINSKTKHAGRYEFQDKMPSHGQHYLKKHVKSRAFPIHALEIR